MIWSLLRILIFAALVTGLAYGAGFLVENGGEIRVTFQGREYAFAPILAVIGLILLMIGFWVLFRIAGLLIAVFRFFNGDETAISRYFTRNRERRGFDALSEAMVALAAGEGRTAATKAARAERLLDRPELTQLIHAQAAEMTGDTDKATTHYKALLTNQRTRFIGVRGLMQQKLAEGDTETAMKLAEKAFGLRPEHQDTSNTLFALQTDHGDWSGARKTLASKVSGRELPRDVGRRREAILLLAEARRLLEAGEVDAGKAEAIQANKRAPDLVPAAVLAAEMHMLNGNKRAATKALRTAWAGVPHPDLAAAFAEIEPDEAAQDRIKRFDGLTRDRINHRESRLLKAELHLSAEDFPAARRALGELADEDDTARTYAILAAIAKGEGAEDEVVRAWLSKAVNAPRGPQWVCSNCKKIHADWAPSCDNCAGFDTLDWTDSPSEVREEATAALLPKEPIAIEDPEVLEDHDHPGV